jgi:hypothetical protein
VANPTLASCLWPAASAVTLALALGCSSGDAPADTTCTSDCGAAGAGGSLGGGAAGSKATGGAGAKAGSAGSAGHSGSSSGAAGKAGAAGAGTGGAAGAGANGGNGGAGTAGAGGGAGTASAGKGGAATGGGGAAGAAGGGLDLPPAPTRGATVPYFEVEAETATTTGVVLPKSRSFGDVASEASGRSAVRLEATGQEVSFVTQHTTNSIVVRYSIPDAPGGGGTAATLGLYVGGTRIQSLALSSRHSWTYGDADAQNEGSESPGAGTAHHFFDEAHAMFGAVPPGTAIALKRDAMDTAASYVIDLVDFEHVGPPLAQPAGSLSITDFGATPDDGTDDSAAVQKAIDAGKAQGKIVWIPKGTFTMPPTPASKPAGGWPKLVASGVTLRGAGMWYSTLEGFGAQFVVSGDANVFADFALFGDVTYRDDNQGWHGFDGPWGKGSSLTRVWIEHQTAALWVGHGGAQTPLPSPLTDGSSCTARASATRSPMASISPTAPATRSSSSRRSETPATTRSRRGATRAPGCRARGIRSRSTRYRLPGVPRVSLCTAERTTPSPTARAPTRRTSLGSICRRRAPSRRGRSMASPPFRASR